MPRRGRAGGPLPPEPPAAVAPPPLSVLAFFVLVRVVLTRPPSPGVKSLCFLNLFRPCSCCLLYGLGGILLLERRRRFIRGGVAYRQLIELPGTGFGSGEIDRFFRLVGRRL
jgi:hypothetical protein